MLYVSCAGVQMAKEQSPCLHKVTEIFLKERALCQLFGKYNLKKHLGGGISHSSLCLIL